MYIQGKHRPIYIEKKLLDYKKENMKKIKELLLKYKEVIMYLIFWSCDNTGKLDCVQSADENFCCQYDSK